MKLLSREGLAFANDGYAILTIEVCALNRTVVLARNAHVGPVNVSGFNIDNDAVWDSSSADNDFSIRPIGVSRMNPAAACFKEKQAANSVFAARRARCPGRLSLSNVVHHPFLKLPKPDISKTLHFPGSRALERFAEEHAAARGRGGDQRITVAQFVADERTASRSDGVSDDARRTNARAAGQHSADEK